MASDREKIGLINDVRSNRLPSPKSARAVEIATASPVVNVENMTFQYNSDGTLSKIVTADKTYSFVWDSKMQLTRIRTAELKR